MSKILFFNFDGTCNSPEDGIQEKKWFSFGSLKDSSITNILKFHIMLGGSLSPSGTELFNGSYSFYYPGVGTYGSFVNKGVNAALSLESFDVEDILDKAEIDFNKIYSQGKFNKIVVTGFSRGAAIARKFASILTKEKNINTPIIAGILDTVASIGMPNFSQQDRPSGDVIFEDRKVAEKIEKALHMVSLDDNRKVFQPTLMNKEDKVTEIWFPGAHADIGGGYGKG